MPVPLTKAQKTVVGLKKQQVKKQEDKTLQNDKTE